MISTRRAPRRPAHHLVVPGRRLTHRTRPALLHHIAQCTPAQCPLRLAHGTLRLHRLRPTSAHLSRAACPPLTSRAHTVIVWITLALDQSLEAPSWVSTTSQSSSLNSLCVASLQFVERGTDSINRSDCRGCVNHLQDCRRRRAAFRGVTGRRPSHTQDGCCVGLAFRWFDGPRTCLTSVHPELTSQVGAAISRRVPPTKTEKVSPCRKRLLIVRP
jgi:hypothetical protein